MALLNAFLALLALGGIVLLATGWSGLESRLPGGLPVGNAVAAAAMILAAGAAHRISMPGSRVRGFAAVALGAALLWLPLSVAVAGNLDLNFGESTGPAWFAFTAFVFAAAFGSLIAAAVALGIARARRA